MRCKADRDTRTEHKQSVSPEVHSPYRTARTALPKAVLAPRENLRPRSLERDELVGCVVSSPVTITKKTPHAARLSTIHVTETLAPYAPRIRNNSLAALLMTEIHIKACLLETSILPAL